MISSTIMNLIRNSPWFNLPGNGYILAIFRLAEPVSSTSIAPYLPEYIEAKGIAKEDIAFWTGMGSGMFFAFQATSAFTWGSMSSRYGRKPCMMTGMFITMIGTILFGFAPNIALALVARAMIGLGNGTTGIFRTAVHEMAPTKSIQSTMQALLSMVFVIGNSIGPAIGGAFANPTHRMPGQPSDGSFFSTYPYALTNLISCTLYITSLTVAFLFLEETLPEHRNRRDVGLEIGRGLTGAVSGFFSRVSSAVSPVVDEDEDEVNERTALLAAEPVKPAPAAPAPWGKPDPMHKILTRPAVMALLAFSMLAMHTLTFEHVLSLFLSLPVADHTDGSWLVFAGGAGLDAATIGRYLSILGFVGFGFGLVFAPTVVTRLQPLRAFRLASVFYAVSYLCIPYASFLAQNSAGQIFLLVLNMALQAVAGCLAFQCSSMTMGFSTPLRNLSTLQNLGVTTSALARGVGPFFTGLAFKLSLPRGFMLGPFLTLEVMALLTLIPLFCISQAELDVNAPSNHGPAPIITEIDVDSDAETV